MLLWIRSVPAVLSGEKETEISAPLHVEDVGLWNSLLQEKQAGIQEYEERLPLRSLGWNTAVGWGDATSVQNNKKKGNKKALQEQEIN